MRSRGFGLLAARLLVTGMLALVTTAAVAQSGGSTSTSGNIYSGINVDAAGVLHKQTVADPGGLLMRERVVAARSSLDPNLAAYSKMRKISLNRLERAILDHQNVVTDEMRYLAGLQRVRYVFYYPETKDIVLAGPAEGWTLDPAERAVGLTTGRPVVQLQDLIAALRTFSGDGSAAGKFPEISCSIDPTKEGLTAKDAFLRSSRPDPNDPTPYAESLRNSLGLQKVTIGGVSPKTHFAQVMVEADYRMKLIGIGLEQPPVKIVSYVARAKPGEGGANGLARWFFVPDYQCVRQSDDKMAMELVGDGVKLVGEDEMVGPNGERHVVSGRGNKSSKAFVTNFTKRYPELAERSPVYAELRNLIDVAIAAAFIEEQGYIAKAGWKMEFFGSEEKYPIDVYDIPKTVETAVNVIWKGTTLMTPIGGGVTIQVAEALQEEQLLSDSAGKVSKTRESVRPNLTGDRWWWD